MQIGIPCHNTGFKNTQSFLPCADIYHINLEKDSFLQEGHDETDINTMNLLSPSSASPYSETDSGISCSFFHYPDPLQNHQHPQPQHFQSFSSQHHLCSTQCNYNYIANLCNHNCISDNNGSKSNETPQYKTDCNSVDKNYDDLGLLNTYLGKLYEEDACLETSNFDIPMTVDYSDSAVSRSNSCGSYEGNLHQPFVYGKLSHLMCFFKSIF